MVGDEVMVGEVMVGEVMAATFWDFALRQQQIVSRRRSCEG
jgi:hypothetical protein